MSKTMLLTPPQILFSDFQISAEEDCACPTSNHSSSIVLPTLLPDALLVASKNLYRKKVDQQHEAFFNLRVGERVVVLDAITQELFSRMQYPVCLNDIRLPQLTKAEILESIQLFFALRLVEYENSPNILTIPKSDTLTAWLHITNACNLRCDYCYILKTAESMTSDVGKTSVEKLFQTAVAEGFKYIKFKYAGGEALLNFRLIKELHFLAVKLANENKLSLEEVILSNGTFLNQNILEFIETEKIKMMISLDGLEQYHDVQRSTINKEGTFETVQNSIKRLMERKIMPTISITITQRNMLGLPELVRWLLEYKLPFSLNFYRSNQYTNSIKDLDCDAASLTRALMLAYDEIRENFPSYSLLGNLSDRARLNQPHVQACGVGNSYIVIGHDGKIAKCHMQMESRLPAQSNNLITMIKTLDGLQNIPVDQKSECLECDWRYYCAGGCPALTYQQTGRYDAKSPNCEIYEQILPKIIELEALRLIAENDFAQED